MSDKDKQREQSGVQPEPEPVRVVVHGDHPTLAAALEESVGQRGMQIVMVQTDSGADPVASHAISHYAKAIAADIDRIILNRHREA